MRLRLASVVISAVVVDSMVAIVKMVVEVPMGATGGDGGYCQCSTCSLLASAPPTKQM